MKKEIKGYSENNEKLILFFLNTFKELEKLIEDGIKFWVEVEILTELKELGLA